MITIEEVRQIMARFAVACVIITLFVMVGALVEYIAHG